MTATSKAPLMDIGAFIHSRRPTTGCQEPNCRSPHVVECKVVLQGHRTGQLCGRRMCRLHAHPGPGGSVCGPHARAIAAAAAKGTSNG